MMGVIHSGGALKRTPMYGTNGMRIPNPRMSMMLTMKSEPSRLSINDSVPAYADRLPAAPPPEQNPRNRTRPETENDRQPSRPATHRPCARSQSGGKES